MCAQKRPPSTGGPYTVEASFERGFKIYIFELMRIPDALPVKVIYIKL